MSRKYKAMVLSCIDPRFQPIIFNYLKRKKLLGKYSSFTIAGSAIGVTALKYKKWHRTFWDNIDTSIKLHRIKKLIVINHRDCGAAKILIGRNKSNELEESKIHEASFKKIKKLFKKKYPNMTIETYLISLNRKIKKII